MFSVKGGCYILEVYIMFNFKILGYIICPLFNHYYGLRKLFTGNV